MKWAHELSTMPPCHSWGSTIHFKKVNEIPEIKISNWRGFKAKGQKQNNLLISEMNEQSNFCEWYLLFLQQP